MSPEWLSDHSTRSDDDLGMSRAEMQSFAETLLPDVLPAELLENRPCANDRVMIFSPASPTANATTPSATTPPVGAESLDAISDAPEQLARWALGGASRRPAR